MNTAFPNPALLQIATREWWLCLRKERLFRVPLSAARSLRQRKTLPQAQIYVLQTILNPTAPGNGKHFTKTLLAAASEDLPQTRETFLTGTKRTMKGHCHLKSAEKANPATQTCTWAISPHKTQATRKTQTRL